MSIDTRIDITSSSSEWIVRKVIEAQAHGRSAFIYLPGKAYLPIKVDAAGAVWIDGRDIAWSPQLTSEQVLRAYEAALSPQLQLL